MAQWEQPRVVAEENGVVPIRGEWGCGDNVEYSYGGRVLDVAQYTQVDDGVIRLHKAVGVLQVDLGVEMAQMFRSLAGFTRQATDPTASAWQIGPRLRILAGNLHSQTGRRFVQIQWGFPVMSYQTSTDARTVSYVSSYLLLGYAWEQQLGPMWFRAFAQAGPQMADRRLAGSIDADFQLAIDAGLVVDFDLAYVRHFHLGFSVRPTIGQELYDRVGTDTIHDRSFPYGLTIDLGWEP